MTFDEMKKIKVDLESLVGRQLIYLVQRFIWSVTFYVQKFI